MRYYLPADHNSNDASKKQSTKKVTSKKPVLENRICLVPDFNILNKYFDYGECDNRTYYCKTVKSKQGVSYKNIQDACDRLSRFLSQDAINKAKYLFDKYDISGHFDNLLFEALIFLHSHWRYYMFVCEEVDTKSQNMELELMKLLVKYSRKGGGINISEVPCAMELSFIKNGKKEKFVISPSYYFIYTDFILSKLREYLVKPDKIFPAELFPDYSVPQDKAKQLEFIEKNFVKLRKGRRNKNLLFSKFIVGMINYLNNETSFKAKSTKIISNKHSIFIYDLLSPLMVPHDPVKPIEKFNDELIDEDKAAYIRDIVSNFNRNI